MQTVDAGTTENWLVVYKTDGSASEGETFRVGIYNSGGYITGVGATSTQSITAGGTPVVGNLARPYQLREVLLWLWVLIILLHRSGIIRQSRKCGNVTIAIGQTS